MLPPELANPFRKPPLVPLNSDTAGFVEDMLGKKARKAFVALDDEPPKPRAKPTEPTEEEKAAMRKAEKGLVERSRERKDSWIHEQVVAWAEKVGKDEDWVNKTFTFLPDGSLIVENDLNIGESPCDRLPQGLKEVHGYLYLNGLTSAEHLTLPASVGGGIYLDKLPKDEKERLREKRPDLRIY